MIRTAILGASGYVGGELLRLLAAHPQLAPVKLFGESKAGQMLGAIHPVVARLAADIGAERAVPAPAHAAVADCQRRVIATKTVADGAAQTLSFEHAENLLLRLQSYISGMLTLRRHKYVRFRLKTVLA